MRLSLTLVLLFCLRCAAGQSVAPQPPPASAQPQLSPQAAYDQAARPVDIVRRPVANWSAVEQAALSVAKAQAAVACAARTPYQYQGEDLLAFARLCSFAELWEPTQQAAMGYLVAQSAAAPADKLTGFPGLSMAFDYEVQASLHLKNTANAFGTAQTMLRTVAYDDLASEAVNGVVRYVQLIQTDQARALLVQRQPILLAMLKARGQPASSAPNASTLVASTRPPMAVHDLYSDAIQLPALLQFMDKPDQAARVYAELEAALPANLSPDDLILNAASRRQYMLLGAPLPPIPASASLLDLKSPAPPDLNRKGSGAAALLLFPDWCAQCVAMNPLFAEITANLKLGGFHFYALLAQADPHAPAPPVSATPKPAAKVPGKPTASSRTAPKAPASPETPKVVVDMGPPLTAAQQLAGTQTLIVPNQLLDTFAATDFPLMVVTDASGIVRYIGIAPDNVLVQGGLMDQVAQRVIEQWPGPNPKVIIQH